MRSNGNSRFQSIQQAARVSLIHQFMDLEGSQKARFFGFLCSLEFASQ